MSEAQAEAFLARVREIMEQTGEPFGPAVNIYIAETYLDRDSGAC